MNIPKTEERLNQIITTCEDGLNARLSRISMHNLINIKKRANYALFTLKKWGTITQETQKYLKELCRQYDI